MNLSDKTILVYDSGSFFETALKLADSFGEVLYFVPWTSGFPPMDKAVIGSEWKNGKQLDSFDGKPLRRIERFFEHLQDADIVLFTDVYDGDLMEHIRSLGIPVCGCGYGQELELERWDTKKSFKEQGMDVQPMKRIVGMQQLRAYLKTVEDKYVKISKYRKTTETFHHKNIILSEPILNKLEYDLGPMGKILEFIIEDKIEAIVEEGIDTYSVDGEYPDVILSGVEIKDAAYAGKIVNYSDLSDGIKRTNDQLSHFLKEYNYRGFLSTEVRTTKAGENYLIDPTMRLPQPPSALYGEIFDNLADIVWETANGNVIDIDPTAQYGLFVTIVSDWYDESHQAIYFPEKYRNNIKLNYPIKVDGNYYCLNINNFPEVGAVVAVGDSFESCKKQVLEIAGTIQGYGIKVCTDAIDVAISEFQKTQKL